MSFVGQLQSRVTKWRHNRSPEQISYNRRRAEAQKWLEAHLPHIAALQSSSTGTNPMVLQYLYEFIVENKPKHILEYGSGFSTFYLAEAARSYGGKITTVENLEWAHEDLKRRLPAQLAPYVQAILAEKQWDEFRGTVWGARYDWVETELPDLVFIDGPTEHQNGRKGCCLDTLYLMERHPDHSFDIITDKKVHTLIGMQRYLPEGRIEYDYDRRIGVIRHVSGGELLASPSSPITPEDLPPVRSKPGD